MTPLPQCLAAFSLKDATLQRIDTGLINDTFLAKTKNERWILQRLNPIFQPEVHINIERATSKLEALGLETTALRPTQNGDLWHTDDTGVWRVLSFVEGEIFSIAPSSAHIEGAGACLGRFHSAIADIELHEASLRSVHDTDGHRQKLEASLETYTEHPAYKEASAIASKTFELLDALPAMGELPDRNVHGDPKLNNIVFRDTHGVCMIDLDTINRMPVVVELGDAMRSWCNPSGEDREDTHFDIELFSAAVRGYLSESPWKEDGLEHLPAETERISLELSMRFCRDALEESYFGWDNQKYNRASEHNLVRAAAQLRLAESIEKQRKELEMVIVKYLPKR